MVSHSYQINITQMYHVAKIKVNQFSHKQCTPPQKGTIKIYKFYNFIF